MINLFIRLRGDLETNRFGKTTLLILSIILLSLGYVNPASAHWYWHHHAYHHKPAHHQHQHAYHHKPAHHHYASRGRIQTTLNLGVGDPRTWTTPLQLHPLLTVARKYLGSGKFTHYSGPWCRDFINVVVRRAGYHLANTSRSAIDALRLGQHVSNPQPGDLVVMRHHVTIFAGYGKRGVIGLGGNQSHHVQYSSYPRRRVLAYVRM